MRRLPPYPPPYLPIRWPGAPLRRRAWQKASAAVPRREPAPGSDGTTIPVALFGLHLEFLDLYPDLRVSVLPQGLGEATNDGFSLGHSSVGGGRTTARRARPSRVRLRPRRRILADARAAARRLRPLSGSSAPGTSRRPSPQGPPPGSRHRRGRSSAAPRGRRVRRRGRHRHLPGPGDDATHRGAGVHGGRDEPVLGRLRDRGHPRALRLVQLRQPGGPEQVPPPREGRLPHQRRPAHPRRGDPHLRVRQLLPLPPLRRRRNLRRPVRGKPAVAARQGLYYQTYVIPVTV